MRYTLYKIVIAGLLILGTHNVAWAGDYKDASMAQGKAKAVSSESKQTDPTPDYMHIPLETISGDTVTLADFYGQTILLVNTASKCGYTPQYKGLQELYSTYRDSGLVVIGFPANNFANQEPGSNEQIARFCEANFGVTFPMMAKVSVKGDDKHPLYVYLTESSQFPGEIQWNFNKFLIAPDGTLKARYPSSTAPMSDDMVEAVESVLKAKAG